MSAPVGDIVDVKAAVVRVLAGAAFLAAVNAIVAEKADGLPMQQPTADSVYAYELLTKQIYPTAEVIGFQVTYPQPDSQVKAGLMKIGVRWTVVEDREATATRSVEILCRATVDALWDDGTGQGLPVNGEFMAGPVIVTEEDYSPLAPAVSGQAAPFVRAGLVLFDVLTYRA